MLLSTHILECVFAIWPGSFISTDRLLSGVLSWGCRLNQFSQYRLCFMVFAKLQSYDWSYYHFFFQTIYCVFNPTFPRITKTFSIVFAFLPQASWSVCVCVSLCFNEFWTGWPLLFTPLVHHTSCPGSHQLEHLKTSSALNRLISVVPVIRHSHHHLLSFW